MKLFFKQLFVPCLWLLLWIGAAVAQMPDAPPKPTELPSAIESCVIGVLEAGEATPEATPEITAETAAVEATATPIIPRTEPPLQFVGFEPYDLRFNPNAENPFALIMNFTLDIANPSQTWAIQLRRPRFELLIETIAWGELASTDFQIGTLPAGGMLGIALQNLTLLNRVNDQQREVITCLQQRKAVDLRVIGHIEANVNGEWVAVEADLEYPDVVFDF